MSPIFQRIVVVSVLFVGCGGTTASTPDASRDARPALDARGSDAKADVHAEADATADGGQLKWYLTCGYPICGAPNGDAGAPDAEVCPDVGSPCTTKGAACGTPSNVNCGATLECDDQNPAVECPESSRKVKDRITYADDATLRRLHEETLGIRLATYTYKPEVADPNVSHLGFIIEDNPGSQAANSARGRVDMYGYVSMVVASMQVQEKEITELKRELETVRKDAAACRGGRR